MTTIRVQRTGIGQHFWLGWVLASSISWSIGALVQTAIISQLAGSTENPVVPWAIDSLLWGLGAGTAQWLVLRGVIHRAGWWVFATGVGWGIAGLIGQSMIGSQGEDFSGIVHIMGTGLLTGILQWLILRHQMMRAGWWIVASLVFVTTGLFAGAVASFGLGLFEPGTLAFGTFFGAVGGTIYGMASGRVLLSLLQPARPAL